MTILRFTGCVLVSKENNLIENAYGLMFIIMKRKKLIDAWNGFHNSMSMSDFLTSGMLGKSNPRDEFEKQPN